MLRRVWLENFYDSPFYDKLNDSSQIAYGIWYSAKSSIICLFARFPSDSLQCVDSLHITFDFALNRAVNDFHTISRTLKRASRKCNLIDPNGSNPINLSTFIDRVLCCFVSNHGPTSACAHNSFDEAKGRQEICQNSAFIQILAQFSPFALLFSR